MSPRRRMSDGKSDIVKYRPLHRFGVSVVTHGNARWLTTVVVVRAPTRDLRIGTQFCGC